MARRYYRRRTVVRAPKKKWCSNFKQGTLTNTNPVVDLAVNSSESGSPTPTILKVGNVKVQGDSYVQTASTGGAALRLVVYFLPEGASFTTSQILEKHPEWVMAWKFVDTPISANASAYGTPFSFSSRLKRNLNSGDKVCIGIDGVNVSSCTIVFSCQYWTCAN